MIKFLIAVAVFFPILAALVIRCLKISFKNKDILNLITVIITSIIGFIVVIIPPSGVIDLFDFNGKLQVYFKVDGLGRIFGGMVCFLWPFAYLYTMSYMNESDTNRSYGMFYVMTFGVILGIAFSGNLITMYFFYEIMTFITLPLIIQPLTKEAKRAGRLYLYISIFGSTLALIGIIILLHYFGTGDFVNTFTNDQLTIYQSNKKLVGICYLLMFLGFGVKAAIFPFHIWLPKAGVAPTPTTALLHAVAVVKAGAFAIIRTIYYIIGSNVINGSVYHIISVLVAAFTIAFGSSMALKELHLKRRLAYSTIANISYIIFAASLMSKFGLYASLLHLIIHSLAKITLFFGAGSMMHHGGITFIDQINGFMKKMPITIICMTLAAFSLIGLPGFGGFVSKFEIAMAAIKDGSWYAIVGICALMYSACLTAIYMFTILVRTIFKQPTKESLVYYDKANDGDIKFKLPMIIFSSLCLLLGFFGNYLCDLIKICLEGVGL